MIHGAGAVPQVQHSRQRPGDVRLGPLHGLIQSIALGQIGGNGAGEGAAVPVGIWIVDALAVEPLARALPPEEIVGVVDLVAALAQHGANRTSR